MDRGVARGKLDEATREAAASAIAWTTDLDDLAGCELVLEAVPERLPLKLEIFGVLDRVLDPAAIMATNTSSIPIIDVAMGTSRPQQVLGMHFFNPATVMKLVEVISTQLTAPEVTEAATAFATDTLGKRVVPAPDRAGFVVNKLLVPYICQAIEMYESGHASASDIDDAMKLGAGHPMGPFDAGRPDRSRRVPVHSRVAVRRVRRALLRAAAAAAPHGGRGPAGTQDRPRLLRVLSQPGTALCTNFRRLRGTIPHNLRKFVPPAGGGGPGLSLEGDGQIGLPVAAQPPEVDEVLSHVSPQEPGHAELGVLLDVDQFVGEQHPPAGAVVVAEHEDEPSQGHAVHSG